MKGRLKVADDSRTLDNSVRPTLWQRENVFSASTCVRVGCEYLPSSYRLEADKTTESSAEHVVSHMLYNEGLHRLFCAPHQTEWSVISHSLTFRVQAMIHTLF